MKSVDKSRANRTNAEAEGDDGNEPTRTNPLAADVEGNFENDVTDVEHGQNSIVVIAFESKVFLKSGQACVAYIGSIDEATFLC